MKVVFETRGETEFAVWTNDNGDSGSLSVEALKSAMPATWALFKKAYDDWKAPPKAEKLVAKPAATKAASKGRKAKK